MDKLIIELLAAVAMHTGLPTADIGLPTVYVVEQCAMISVAQGAAAGAECETNPNPDGLSVWGVYWSPNDELYLRNDVPLDSVEGMATLFHELVHFAQDKARGDVEVTDFCTAASMELQAYRAEGQFVMQMLGLASPAEAYEILGTGMSVAMYGTAVNRCEMGQSGARV